MTDLHGFQSDFSGAVKADDPGARPKDLNDDVSWRFNVYRNNYFHGLIEQLKEAYPEVRRLLGDEGFTVVAKGFLVKNPPEVRSLALFGKGFPEYLAALPATQDSPLLYHMARLERAWLEALHAADQMPLDPSGLAQLGEKLPETRFDRHAAAHIITSQIPLLDHWRVRQPGTQAPEPQNSEAGAQAVLVTRPKLSVQICTLTKSEVTFGEGLFEGKPVSEAFEKAINCDDAFDITEAFRTFLAAGAFAGVAG